MFGTSDFQACEFLKFNLHYVQVLKVHMCQSPVIQSEWVDP